MDGFFALFGVVALAFASTNLDNLLVLISWQIAGAASAGRLFAGYAVGMLGVLMLALLIGLVGYLFPLRYLGFLGLVPILLADSRLIFDAEIAALFLLLALLWFGLARLLGERAVRSPLIGRMGRWLAPLVMISVGVYILSDTATDMG